jgi:hypothetical protein
MSFAFHFVSNALSYCGKCERLTTEPRLNSPENIRAAAPYVGNARPEDLVELAQIIASAIDRRCGRCKTRLKTLRYSDAGKPSKCPKCSKKTLRLEPVGIWD